MIVAELRIVLDHVPEDLVIFVPGHPTRHVGHVRRQRFRRNAHPGFEVEDGPASLTLEPPYWWEGRHAWWEPEPPFQLDGPFRRSAELERRLDGVR